MKKLLIIVIGVLLVGCSMDNQSNSKERFVGTWVNKWNWDYTLNTDYDEWQLIFTEDTIYLRIRWENGIYSGSRYSFDSCDDSMIYFTGLISGNKYWQEYKFISNDEIQFGSTNHGNWSGTLIRIK
jgi:hypothetical protein